MAAKTWGAGTGAGADGLWSTGANWTGDTVPATTDTITFDATAVTNCNIDALGTFSGGTFTVQSTYTGQITQNVTMTTAAFVMNGNNASAYTQAANLTTTTFNITTGVITFGFTVSSGNFQCSNLGVSSGFLDFSGVGTCLTTGTVAFSTAVGTPSVAITCPPGTWETRSNWSHAGADLITFNANGGTVSFTGTIDGVVINVSSITFNLCVVNRSNQITFSSGTTIPLGSNPASTFGTLDNNGTITASGTWTITGSTILRLNASSVTSGAITKIITNGSVTINATASLTATVPFDFAPTITTRTITATAYTFGTCTVVSVGNAAFRIAAGTTIPLGANPTTSTGTVLFEVIGTATASGTWAHTGGFQVNAGGVVSGAITAFNASIPANTFTVSATGTFPSGVVLTVTGSGNWSLDATAVTFGQVILNRTVDATTTLITAGTEVPLGTNPTINLGFNPVTWSGDFSATGVISYTGGNATFGAASVITGTFTWKHLVATNFTVNAATTWPSTGGFEYNVTTANNRVFAGGGKTFALFRRTGSNSAQISITGTNTFTAFEDNEGSVAHTLIFPNVTTTVGTFAVSGSVGKLVTLARTGAAGTFTLTKSTAGNVTQVAFISVSNSTVDVAPVWYAGATPPSVDGTGNTNWIFTEAPVSIKNRKQAVLL